MVPSIITLDDVKDSPSVRMDFPGTLSIGERVLFRFVLRRRNGTRNEELRVDGEYRVLEVVLDATCSPVRSLVKVSAKGLAPSWRAVKKQPQAARRLAPTHTKLVVE